MDTEKLRKVAVAVIDGCKTSPDGKHDKLPSALINGLVKAVARMPVAKLDKYPLSKKQVEKRKNEEGFITVIVSLSLEELGVGVECLNDVVSDMVLGESSGLEDVSYSPVGIAGDEVLVEVTGNVGSWLDGV